MIFKLSSEQPQKIQIDILVLPVLKDKKQITDSINFLLKNLRNYLLNIAERQNFKGKTGEHFLFFSQKPLPYFGILLIGLGESDKLFNNEIRETAGIAINIAEKYKAKKLAFKFSEEVLKKIGLEILGQALAEGALLSDYKFENYKSQADKTKTRIKEIIVLSNETKIKHGIQKGKICAEAAVLARNLVNQPSFYMTPKKLVEEAEKISKNNKNIELKIYNQKKLQELGFGGILAVAQGSNQEPYLIHLIYRRNSAGKTQKSRRRKKIALIGKGLTFDSGGISLKPADYMENMKMDMAGAAAVLGVFNILNQDTSIVGQDQNFPEIHGLIPVCENMPSGRALKPGDVIKIYNGKTVEIINTDAEGRLILADALAYAVKQKVDLIIDLATLTGACIVALGDYTAGLFSNNELLASQLLEASRKSGEDIWQMPLYKKYQKKLKSQVADLRNVSKMKGAGAITAALFLKEFVGKTKWAHLDIAGPAWAEEEINSYTKIGGTGFGARLLLEFLNSFSLN